MLDKLKTVHLVIFVLVGMVVMTIVILNMQVKRELAETLLEQYNKGQLNEQAYKKALADGKITYLESFGLRKKSK